MSIRKLRKVFVPFLIAVILIVAVQSCHAQKHHKSLPCPCEKKRK